MRRHVEKEALLDLPPNIKAVHTPNDMAHEEGYDAGSIANTTTHDAEVISSSSPNGAGGVVHVSTPILLLSALPLLLIAYFGDDLGIRNNVLIATARCFIQLLFLGMILHPIFVMGMDMPWLVGLCECTLLWKNIANSCSDLYVYSKST